MSLFQKGPNGEERTEVEAALFQKSLTLSHGVLQEGGMMQWYSHPKVFTFKLTKLPKGYPTGFKFPPGVEPNLADYDDRCERCLLTPHSPYSHTRCGLDFVQGLVLLRVVSQQPDQGLDDGARPRQV